jgi:hypothetical protein
VRRSLRGPAQTRRPWRPRRSTPGRLEDS